MEQDPLECIRLHRKESFSFTEWPNAFTLENLHWYRIKCLAINFINIYKTISYIYSLKCWKCNSCTIAPETP